MEAEGLEMNAYFLYALLIAHASARPRQAERAEAAFKAARDRGIEVNKHVLAALVLRAAQTTVIGEIGPLPAPPLARVGPEGPPARAGP